MYNLPIRQKNDSKYALGKEKKAEEVSQGRGGAILGRGVMATHTASLSDRKAGEVIEKPESIGMWNKKMFKLLKQKRTEYLSLKG